MNLTDLVLTKNNVDTLSNQFGLSQDEAIQAVAALIPAFSHGLKRNAATPQGAAGLIETLASGRHAPYVQNSRNTTQPFGITDGKGILGHLFGNKDVSRALSDHASASSGIGSSILRQMLPVIASMVMGGLFKGATSGGQGRGGGGFLGSLIEGLAGGMGAPTRRSSRRIERQMQQRGGGLEDLLGSILGGSSAPRTPRKRRRASPRQNNRRTRPSAGGIFDELLGEAPRRRQSRSQSRQRPARRRRSSGGGLGEIFGDLLEPGRQTNADYQRQTGSIFDEFLGN